MHSPTNLYFFKNNIEKFTKTNFQTFIQFFYIKNSAIKNPKFWFKLKKIIELCSQKNHRNFVLP